MIITGNCMSSLFPEELNDGLCNAITAILGFYLELIFLNAFYLFVTWL